MTVSSEIEQLKTQLAQTTDEQVQAEFILALLKKYASTNSQECKPYAERLLQLAEKSTSLHDKGSGSIIWG